MNNFLAEKTKKLEEKLFHVRAQLERASNTKNSVFVYIGTCVPWMATKTKFSILCIFCNLDEYLYA